MTDEGLGRRARAVVDAPTQSIIIHTGAIDPAFPGGAVETESTPTQKLAPAEPREGGSDLPGGRSGWEAPRLSQVPQEAPISRQAQTGRRSAQVSSASKKSALKFDWREVFWCLLAGFLAALILYMCFWALPKKIEMSNRCGELGGLYKNGSCYEVSGGIPLG